MRMLWILAFVAATTAGETATPPSWADEISLRPEWRQALLGTVLDEIEKKAGCPVIRSKGVESLANSRVVILIERERQSLRTVLAALGKWQGLHCTIDPMRLLVETQEEADLGRRRPVGISLRDYGWFAEPKSLPGHRDAPTDPNLSSDGDLGHGVLLGGFPGLEAESRKDLDEAMRGTGHLRLLATPETEARLRNTLAARFARMTLPQSWMITTGTLVADQPCPSGLVTVAQAEFATKNLGDRVVLTCVGMNGQRISSEQTRPRNQLTTFDVVGGEMDPKVEGSNPGRQVDLIATAAAGVVWTDSTPAHIDASSSLVRIAFALAWEDSLNPPVERQYRKPAEHHPLSFSGDVGKSSDGSNQSIRLDAKPAVLKEPVVMAVELPQRWSWRPRGVVTLVRGQALILIADHPTGRAVAVIQEAP